MMQPLGWRVLATVFVASVGFALILDQIKQPVDGNYSRSDSDSSAFFGSPIFLPT